MALPLSLLCEESERRVALAPSCPGNALNTNTRIVLNANSRDCKRCLTWVGATLPLPLSGKAKEAQQPLFLSLCFKAKLFMSHRLLAKQAPPSLISPLTAYGLSQVLSGLQPNLSEENC